MHLVLWEDNKWQKWEMHQLITPAEVKKAYRKACLAVHPDKVTKAVIFFLFFWFSKTKICIFIFRIY